MKIHKAFYFNNGTALVTDYHEHGTLLVGGDINANLCFYIELQY